jgi:ABC-type transport system substrate-binding protein
MKWFYIVAALCVVALALAPLWLLKGEGSDPYPGKIVRWDSYESEVKSVDPATCGDTTSAAVQGNIYESLYCYHYLKRPVEVIPKLAVDMPTVSEDGLTYTMRIKPGIKYHRNPCFGREADGRYRTRTVRADDFVLAYKRCADYHINTGLAWAFLSERVVGIDEFRERTQGIPAKEVERIARIDAWRNSRSATAPPAEVLADLIGIVKWSASLHPPAEISKAFEKIGAWCKAPQGGSSPEIADAFAKIDAWRPSMRGYKKGDFSRYDMPLEGVKSLDELTLQIRLTARFPQLIYVLAIGFDAPIPREAVDYWLATKDDGQGGRVPVPPEDVRTEFTEAPEVVGTGPYILQTRERKSKIVMVRNPDFRLDLYPSEGEPGDANAGLLDDANKPVPFIDVIHWDYVAQEYAAWMRFLSKQTDVGGIPRETFQFVISPTRDLSEEWKKKHIELSVYTRPVIRWIIFNMEDPVVGKSKSLRQALCLSFDVENFIKVLHNGRGIRAVNVLPQSFKGHQEAGPSPYGRLDMEEARKKIEEAKKELAAAGSLVNGQIPELKLDIGDRGAEAMREGDFIRQQFQKLGIRLKVNYNDWPTQQEKLNNKQSQLAEIGWDSDYPDAENFLQLYYGPNIDKQTNNSNYSNPEFDKLYEQVRVMSDTPQRTELYAKMVRMLSEDCPVLLLSEPVSFLLYYDWVKNTKPNPAGYGYTKYHRIDEAQRKAEGGR